MPALPISLDSVGTMPRELRALMKPLRSEFKRHLYADSYAHSPSARSIMAQVAEYLATHSVVGVHYTRAERRDIESGGLLCGPGASRRAWFLENYGSRFSPAERGPSRRLGAGATTRTKTPFAIIGCIST